MIFRGSIRGVGLGEGADLHEGRVDRDADCLDYVLFGCRDLQALQLLQRLLQVRESAEDAGLPL